MCREREREVPVLAQRLKQWIREKFELVTNSKRLCRYIWIKVIYVHICLYVYVVRLNQEGHKRMRSYYSYSISASNLLSDVKDQFFFFFVRIHLAS